MILLVLFLFFFNDTATTEIYTLSLHDALPISLWIVKPTRCRFHSPYFPLLGQVDHTLSAHTQLFCHLTSRQPRLQILQDRKSTRLNSSHANISYAVFCLKKKKIINNSNNDIK